MTARTTVEVHTRSEAILADLIDLSELCLACYEQVVIGSRDTRLRAAGAGISPANSGVVSFRFGDAALPLGESSNALIQIVA